MANKEGRHCAHSLGRTRPYSLLECQLIEAVRSSLQLELYANAAFLCERLHAEVANEEIRLMLAECYLGIHFNKKAG